MNKYRSAHRPAAIAVLDIRRFVARQNSRSTSVGRLLAAAAALTSLVRPTRAGEVGDRSGRDPVAPAFRRPPSHARPYWSGRVPHPQYGVGRWGVRSIGCLLLRNVVREERREGVGDGDRVLFGHVVSGVDAVPG